MSPATVMALGALAAMPSHAAPVTVLAMKVSDATPGGLDPYLGWVGPGGFNEGDAAAQLLVNNGLDYKASFVDAWSGILGVRVSFFRDGAERAFATFTPGTPKINFFSRSNVVSSSWSDFVGPGNFFAIEGDASVNRHWFVNNNYGGCPADAGHIVVGGGTGACTWECSRMDDIGSATRGFLYSTGTTEVNWNSANVGVADVVAVFVTVDRIDPVTGVPVPGTSALVAGGLAALGLARRRREA